MNKTFNFNHDANNFLRALGVDENLAKRVKEIIFFSTICNFLIRGNMFDDDNDVPNNLKTVTGDLEKALSFVQTEEEKNLLLIMFKDHQDVAMENCKRYKFLQESPEKERKALKLMLKLAEVKMEDEGKNLNLRPSDIFKRIKYVEKVNYNFDKYFDIVAADMAKDDIFVDIDD